MDKEIWKEYPKMPKVLMVSNKGNLKTKTRIVNSGNGKRIQEGIPLSLSSDKDGYLIVGVSNFDERKTLRVHRVVLETFFPVQNEKELSVNHKDGVKTNNSIENLEWVTHKENIQHAIKTGLMPKRERKTYQYTCKKCGKSFDTIEDDAVFCSASCSSKSSRVVQNRPSKEELYCLLKEKSFSELSRIFGISGNGIRKWCRLYGIPDNAKYYKDSYRNL